MGRPPKSLAKSGLPSLRRYWRELNRLRRDIDADEREARKAHDKRRRKCWCEAYPWPHRPKGGLCRYPDPPVGRYQRKGGSRPYRERYAGIRRQIARKSGLHPIRDRAAIESLIPEALKLAKELKRRQPKLKYRNMEVTANGVTGNYHAAGPMM